MTVSKTTNSLSVQATILCTVGLMVPSSFAISAETFESVSSVIGSGGAKSSGGDFVMTGTIGQPLVEKSSGGDFVLHSGFWPTVFEPEPKENLIFEDSFE